MGEPIEERMMAEWASSRLAPGTYAFHVRLGQARGPPPSGIGPAEWRAYMSTTLPEADLVIRHPTSVEIVEFIVWRPQETLGQLLYYGHELLDTPGFEDLDPRMVRLRIVTGLEDSRFEEFARALGVAYEVFRPAWLLEALAARRGGPPG